MSNLWAEYEDALKLCENDGINPVLALATDDLTENVFIITEDYSLLEVKYKRNFYIGNPQLRKFRQLLNKNKYSTIVY